MSSFKPKLSSIPVHKLQERTDLGMEMRHIINASKSDFANILLIAMIIIYLFFKKAADARLL